MRAPTVAPGGRAGRVTRVGGPCHAAAMADHDHTHPASRPARVGAVDEYVALQRAAMDRLVRHGLDAAAATVHLRAEARRLAAERGLDRAEAAAAVDPFVAATEAAIVEVHDDLRRLTRHVLHLARARLGLA